MSENVVNHIGLFIFLSSTWTYLSMSSYVIHRTAYRQLACRNSDTSMEDSILAGCLALARNISGEAIH